jgi:hypothetical protein
MPRPGEIDQTYPNLLEQENRIKLLEPFKGAKKRHRMKCMICEHVWSATPISKRQTYKKYKVGGCPECNKTTRERSFEDTRQRNIEQLKQRGIEILTPGYDGRRHLIDNNTYAKILVRNTVCGHEFECSPSNLLTQHVECAVCGPQKRIAPLTAWSKENSRKWRETASEWELYKSAVTSLTEQTYTKHKESINPKKLPRGRAGEEGAYHLDHIVPKRFCFENGIPPEVCADRTNLQMIGWRENVGSRNKLKGAIPHVFLQYIDDNARIQTYIDLISNRFPNLQSFVNINGVTATLIDIQANVAILILPTSQPFGDQKTGNLAMKAWSETKLRYFIVFEDEINNNFELVISKISHYIGKNTSVPRIHARQCSIVNLDTATKRDFLTKNHIQGNDNSQLAYGAYHGDALVAVMTFTQPRVALGYKSKDRNTYRGIWELSRFATDINYRIPGIASKLLKHFQTNNPKWKRVISYADARWSVGKLYDTLGFQLEARNPPDYFYVVNGQRKHRWNYRKDILKTKLVEYTPNLTEYQNMKNAGYWRVWDCGTLRYVLTNTDVCVDF